MSAPDLIDREKLRMEIEVRRLPGSVSNWNLGLAEALALIAAALPATTQDEERRDAIADDRAFAAGYAAGRVAERRTAPPATTPALDVERLARAWGSVMDGRRIRQSGMGWARIEHHTTTTEDWAAIAREYAALAPQEPDRLERTEP